jgi:hypothetical protein
LADTTAIRPKPFFILEKIMYKFIRIILAIGILALGTHSTNQPTNQQTPILFAADDPKLPTGG